MNKKTELAGSAHHISLQSLTLWHCEVGIKPDIAISEDRPGKSNPYDVQVLCTHEMGATVRIFSLDK